MVGYFARDIPVTMTNLGLVLSRAMNTDAEVYGDDYDTFRPERFLDETGKKEKVPPNTHGEVSVHFTSTCITTC